MFPRIKKSISNGRNYEYLVISESIRIKGKYSTTKDIANIGNIEKLNTNDINGLIDGFIRIFQLEDYSLTEGTEILESLEHGSIIFWQKMWDELKLSETIYKQVKIRDKRVKLEVANYIQMMTINRCVNPLSKLGATRWVEDTCYKQMKGYANLSLDVTYFYRSMDQLLKIKDNLELAIFNKLKNLFSINVKLTFYDITSTFFYTGSCPISENGYSRDDRPDKEQIVIGVVTSWEGYPIKHYVFTGNTKDETTVKKVIEELKEDYCIEETTFVGDRGMITKLNLTRLQAEGFDYIMGVKIRQDEICEMLFSEHNVGGFEEYKDLKIKEKKIKIKEFLLWKIKRIVEKNAGVVIEEKFHVLEEKIFNLDNHNEPTYKIYKEILYRITEQYDDELRYIICLNDERKKSVRKRRQERLSKFSKELDKLFSSDKESGEIEKSLSKLFEGYKKKYRKFFKIKEDTITQKAVGYTLNQEQIKRERKYDGIFVLLTNRSDLEKSKVVESYKNLKEVEMLFDDLKNFVDIRPVRHWLEIRVRGHVFICILSLLLKRIFEIKYMKCKSVTEAFEEIAKSKLIKYKVKFSQREERSKTFVKVTNLTAKQKKYFSMVGIKNPMSLEKFTW
jgi:transposase